MVELDKQNYFIKGLSCDNPGQINIKNICNTNTTIRKIK